MIIWFTATREPEPTIEFYHVSVQTWIHRMSQTSGRNIQDVQLNDSCLFSTISIQYSTYNQVRLNCAAIFFIPLHLFLMIRPCELVQWTNYKYSIEKSIGRVTSAHWHTSKLLYLPVGDGRWRWKQDWSENTAQHPLKCWWERFRSRIKVNTTHWHQCQVI